MPSPSLLYVITVWTLSPHCLNASHQHITPIKWPSTISPIWSLKNGSSDIFNLSSHHDTISTQVYYHKTITATSHHPHHNHHSLPICSLSNGSSDTFSTLLRNPLSTLKAASLTVFSGSSVSTHKLGRILEDSKVSDLEGDIVMVMILLSS